MGLKKKARKAIEDIGFTPSKNDKNTFYTDFHIVEIVKRDSTWFSIQVIGESFSIGTCPYPTDYDITCKADLEEAIQHIKEALRLDHFAKLNKDLSGRKKGSIGKVSINHRGLRMNFGDGYISVDGFALDGF